MALEDVAKLVSPRAPEIVLKILGCFYNKEGLTREEILKETGLNGKAFEYYLTKLRHFRLIQGEGRGGIYRYRLSPDGFHSRVDTLFVDPIKTLRGR